MIACCRAAVNNFGYDDYRHKRTGIFLLLFTALVAAEALKDKPQQQRNATLNLAITGSLNIRDLFGLDRRDYYECPSGYAQCEDNASQCCPSGDGCCIGYDTCVKPGSTCCKGGSTCPSGWKCCGDDTCAPEQGVCCGGGHYCDSGYTCGTDGCCPSSGCTSEVVVEGSTTSSIARNQTESITESITSTSTFDLGPGWSTYSTTYYWSYWVYFWASNTTTRRTVTSTLTTTSTVWAFYAEQSTEPPDVASAFSHSAALISQSPPPAPYSATYLKSSASSTSNGGVSGSPSGLSGDWHMVLMGAILAGLVGGLAIGL